MQFFIVSFIRESLEYSPATDFPSLAAEIIRQPDSHELYKRGKTDQGKIPAKI